MVHADYFETFLTQVLPPMYITFGERVEERRDLLETGDIGLDKADRLGLIDEGVSASA